MASLLSRYAPAMRRGKKRFEEFDKAEREQTAALEESGRDPYAERLQSLVPVNVATEEARERGPLAGLASWAGGGPGQGAMNIIANPMHPIAQFLSKYYPKVSAALERNPFRFEFQDVPEADRSVMMGFTDVPTGALRGPQQEMVSLPAMRGIQARPEGKNIGIQVDPTLSTGAANVTTLHEVLHGLYGTKPNPAHLGGEEAAYSSFGPSAERASDIVYGNVRPSLQGTGPAMRPAGRFSQGSAGRAGLTGSDIERLAEFYEPRGGAEHLSVETLARAMYEEAQRRDPALFAQQSSRPLAGEPGAGGLAGLRRRLFGR